MTANDLDLLRDFARDHLQDAFTALVQRHLDLVYCAALRQVRSPQLAEEVAQSVFADLARNATRLNPDTVLTAWLYQVTHRTAIDVVRRESRRQLREQIASEMNAMNATADHWTQIEPLLDEAMHALDDTDRTAVLLRYFENKSLREVGETLGTTDDAARKRVSRAVDRLREFFAKHGINVGASGLAVVISSNAVQAAPVGLSVTIATTTALTGTTLATTAAKAIAMTTLQKTFVFWALIGGLLVINTVAILVIIGQRTENASLRAQLDGPQTDSKRSRPRTYVAPPADPNAFANVAESAIPGRYRWIKSGEEKGVVTLNPDHSFANEKGEKFRVYQWELAADALTLTWQRGPVRFTVVEASGVYVAIRPDGQTERLEKVE